MGTCVVEDLAVKKLRIGATTGLALAGVVVGVAAGARAADGAPPRLWLGAELAQDLPLVSGEDVCTKSGQLDEGFACFRSSGSQYHGTPIAGRDDAVNTGFVLGTTRLKLALDHALLDDVTAGARLGYVLRGGGPTEDGGSKFFPLHAELRVAYWPLGPAHQPHGVSLFVFANGGLAEVDGKTSVTVIEDPSAPPPPSQPDNPPRQQLDVYTQSGSGFAGLGAGAYLPAGAAHGPSLELGLIRLFPTPGTALVIALGYGFGV